MKVIAESSSTRTEWALVSGNEIVEHAYTSGLNPYFQSRREISHSIRLELPECFFKRRWEHIYFYGAGCANTEKNKVMESSLVAQFKTPVTVESDLLGAARGLLIDSPGLVCILSTGSNSCYYDGQQVTKNVISAGFILGNEGSNSYLGKLFIADILKCLAPEQLIEAFYDKYHVTATTLMDETYSRPLPDRALAHYSTFLSDYVDTEYVYNLIYQAFMSFFTRNISQYNYRELPLHFVGSTCCIYSDILRKVADDFGANIAKIKRCSLPGLIEYHAQPHTSLTK